MSTAFIARRCLKKRTVTMLDKENLPTDSADMAIKSSFGGVYG